MMRRLALLILLLAPLTARAQCTGGLIVNCPAAQNPQGTDLVLGWQFGETPHMRALTLSQIEAEVTAGFLPLTGGTIDGPLSVTGTFSASDGGTLGGTFAGGTLTGATINDTPIGTGSAAAGAFTLLSASSSVSGAGFTAWAASPPPIGGTAPAAGAFTTLSASGVLTPAAGIVGTTAGGNATAGNVGEYIFATLPLVPGFRSRRTLRRTLRAYP